MVKMKSLAEMKVSLFLAIVISQQLLAHCQFPVGPKNGYSRIKVGEVLNISCNYQPASTSLNDITWRKEYNATSFELIHKWDKFSPDVVGEGWIGRAFPDRNTPGLSVLLINDTSVGDSGVYHGEIFALHGRNSCSYTVDVEGMTTAPIDKTTVVVAELVVNPKEKYIAYTANGNLTLSCTYTPTDTRIQGIRWTHRRDKGSPSPVLDYNGADGTARGRWGNRAFMYKDQPDGITVLFINGTTQEDIGIYRGTFLTTHGEDYCEFIVQANSSNKRTERITVTSVGVLALLCGSCGIVLSAFFFETTTGGHVTGDREEPEAYRACLETCPCCECCLKSCPGCKDCLQKCKCCTYCLATCVCCKCACIVERCPWSRTRMFGIICGSVFVIVSIILIVIFNTHPTYTS